MITKNCCNSSTHWKTGPCVRRELCYKYCIHCVDAVLCCPAYRFALISSNQKIKKACDSLHYLYFNRDIETQMNRTVQQHFLWYTGLNFRVLVERHDRAEPYGACFTQYVLHNLLRTCHTVSWNSGLVWLIQPSYFFDFIQRLYETEFQCSQFLSSLLNLIYPVLDCVSMCAWPKYLIYSLNKYVFK